MSKTAQEYIDISNQAFALGYHTATEGAQYRAYCIADHTLSALGQTPSLAVKNCCRLVMDAIEDGHDFSAEED